MMHHGPFMGGPWHERISDALGNAHPNYFVRVAAAIKIAAPINEVRSQAWLIDIFERLGGCDDKACRKRGRSR
jgi:hypothetical protein